MSCHPNYAKSPAPHITDDTSPGNTFNSFVYPLLILVRQSARSYLQCSPIFGERCDLVSKGFPHHTQMLIYLGRRINLVLLILLDRRRHSLSGLSMFTVLMQHITI